MGLADESKPEKPADKNFSSVAIQALKTWCMLVAALCEGLCFLINEFAVSHGLPIPTRGSTSPALSVFAKWPPAIWTALGYRYLLAVVLLLAGTVYCHRGKHLTKSTAAVKKTVASIFKGAHTFRPHSYL
jgi:hypothetical protein